MCVCLFVRGHVEGVVSNVGILDKYREDVCGCCCYDDMCG